MIRFASLLILFALLFNHSAFARINMQINAIVSANSAAEFAAGANRLHQRHPGIVIQARTPEQLAELHEAELRAWLQPAQLLFAVGLFGPEVERLHTLISEFRGERFIIHSERELVLLSRINGVQTFADPDDAERFGRLKPDGDIASWLTQQAQRHPRQYDWLTARSYWLAGGTDNIANLLGWFGARLGAKIETVEPQMRGPLRFRQQGNERSADALRWTRPGWVAVLDHGRADRAGDRDLSDAICQKLAARDLDCVTLLADWGGGSIMAAQWIRQQATHQKSQLIAIVSLQDFVIGGGEGREQVTSLLQQIDVPVLKGLRLEGRSETQWRLSADGLPEDKVHYQLAMPELQGASQPLLLAGWQQQQIDALTGLRFGLSAPIETQIDKLVARLTRWQALRQKANADKRVAIIYYNHPPGRHNIGADNLDVPRSLWEILQALKRDGYNTGELPASPAALLDLLQQRGINLPEQNDALTAMAREVETMSAADYRSWFDTLPAAVRNEMVHGPFGYLLAQLQSAAAAGEMAIATATLDHAIEEFRHLLEGVEHPARERALNLLQQFDADARRQIGKAADADWGEAARLVAALADTGIEGIRGWGEAPGYVMVNDGRLVLPGLRFGNIFVGPQPPRGWEVDEELLHANLVFPPPHQYLAFYHYLRDKFRADALVHIGRHSTYEFLPRRRAALGDDDYADLIVGDLPSIYPYIVDGVGEGIQAKRRGLAVMVDHLTPPLAATELYDDLLQLRQLVESYETGAGSGDTAARRVALAEMRALIGRSGIERELRESMADPLAVRGISYEQVDGELFAHEVGHYLTQLQERFMPLGLHVFGKNWDKKAVDTMLQSMGTDADNHRQALVDSPRAEMSALLAALNGRFVVPGKGNDPIRTPEALPTGRNFHALDSSLLPTRIGWRMGRELAQRARENKRSSDDGRDAVILWASDTVRDEGTMVAFGLDLLGVEPIWNGRGIVQGIKRRALMKNEQRRDLVFTSSGLFRDLYGDQLALLERASLMALDGAAATIRSDYPALAAALAAALEPLGEASEPGRESLQQNLVAAHWVDDARKQLAAGRSAAEAGRLAALRLFGVAPGGYGAGINRMVERSGAWSSRSEVADVYVRRMGHAYGSSHQGEPVPALFGEMLKTVRRTYLGRSSNLYGLMDNNDAFDFLGGLSLAVERASGRVPDNFVSWHADPERIRLEPLSRALLGELRGRFLNPQWITALMQHDYAGARTMGSEFVEYLWGWQVTNPDIITSEIWEAVKAVYIDDKYHLKLDDFLERNHNVHVKTNMLAIMLVAIQKQFWPADAETIAQLGDEFAQLVIEHGLPGSGHTRPDHPMLQWLLPQLKPAQADALRERLARAQVPQQSVAGRQPSVIAELQQADVETATNTDENDQNQDQSIEGGARYWWLLMLAALLLAAGIWRGGVWRTVGTRRG
jgi:cobaltochelatase CobN